MKKAIVLLSGGLDSSTALYLAKSQGFDEIYAITFEYGQKHDKELKSAMSEVDYSGYVDCREEFIKAMENAINLGTVLGAEKKQRITIHAPFMHLTKAEEVKLGVSLGVDFGLTWTCYRGGEHPCGVCDSCLLRAKAFAEANEIDPLVC